jgi:hypothetical protein
MVLITFRMAGSSSTTKSFKDMGYLVVPSELLFRRAKLPAPGHSSALLPILGLVMHPTHRAPCAPGYLV